MKSLFCRSFSVLAVFVIWLSLATGNVIATENFSETETGLGNEVSFVTEEPQFISTDANEEFSYQELINNPKDKNMELENASGTSLDQQLSASSDEGYLWPVPNCRYISCYYGNGHAGIDIASSSACNIVAARGGTVIEAQSNACPHVSAKCSCNYGMGNYVKISQNDGRYSTYMHLKKGTLTVSVGQTVNQGDKIGEMGSSGNSSGQHLHYQLTETISKKVINTNPDAFGYKLEATPQTLPFRSCIDSPVQGDVETGKTFILRGWALHQNNISRMTYKINDGSEKELNRVGRDDVFGVFPDYRSTNNLPGFAQDIDCDELAIGSNVVYVFADTTDGKKEVGRVGIVRNILPLACGIFENNKVITDTNPVLDGWVLHGSGITKLTYSVDGGPEIESQLIRRVDVENNAYLQGYPKVNSGINVKLNLGELRSGAHTITFKATAGTGKIYNLEQRTFIVKESNEPVKTINRNGKTYSIYNQSSSWVEAKAKAESLGGCLMSITSAEENDIARELIQAAGRRITWIGGTDQAKENVWQWSTTEKFEYANWGSGEPNNSGGNENCIGILNSEQNYWNDFPDNYLGGSFIIEDDDDLPSISNIQVTEISSSGYTVICTVTDKSGIMKVQFPTWTLANGQDDLNGDWKVNTKYSGVINGNTISYRVNNADHNYEQGIYRTHIYAYDYFGNCRAISVEESCGDTTLNNDLTPVSTVSFNNSEYLLIDNILTFSEAIKACERLGGNLVTITSQDEQNILQNLVSKGKRTAYYIGASDEKNEGTFSWINGEAFSYTNWNGGEPNNSTATDASGEDYGCILTAGGKWNDVHATHTIGFICEKPITQSLLAIDLKTDKASNQTVGTRIRLVANASGGTAPYQYKFYAKVGDETTLISDYSTSATAVFIPDSAGSYSLFVDVKDGTGTTATKTIDSFIIYIPQPEEPEVPDDNNDDTDNTDVTCTYQTHVQNVGWQDWKNNGDMSGTSGKGLRLEGIRIKTNTSELGLSYATHVQNIGWQDPVAAGVMSGTSGLGLRLEAIRINLTGAKATQYDIYYRVHAQNVGWLDWAVNGADSGTAGFGYRLEGIEIKVLPKGSAPPGDIDKPFVSR